MPFKIMIEADNLGIAQAALAGVVRALAEETGPAVLSDQAPSDIVQSVAEPELPFANGIEEWVDAAPDPVAAEPTPEPAPEPKKRGRKPKAAAPVVIEDIEPPPEVVTEEDEPEAEGAVDAPEPEPANDGVSAEMLQEKVREIMDEHGIPAAIALLGKAGYKKVSQVPPADYDRVYAILIERA
jgi:hypothetical protein